ncbi:MAG: hypothetical protein ABI076_07255 [Acidobacteriaceae bacterium]
MAQADPRSTPSSRFSAGNLNPAPTPASAARVEKSSNSLLKLGVAFVVIIFVGGILALGGVFYAAHKVSQKAHEIAARATNGEGLRQSAAGTSSGVGEDTASSSGDSNKISGNPCRFLSVDEVSRATGVTIIRAEPKDDGCAYIGRGDPADATAKHMGAMLAKKGVKPEQQAMLQKFAGGFFAQQEAGDKDLSAEAAKQEITPLAISFEMGHAAAAMRLNQKVMGNLGNKHEITGIGDEAFDSAEGMMTVRKGDNLIRFVYVSCPCNSDAIKPLAQKVAAAF